MMQIVIHLESHFPQSRPREVYTVSHEEIAMPFDPFQGAFQIEKTGSGRQGDFAHNIRISLYGEAYS